uniref:Uncharacterized protein n=1 Tax=Glossina palpalis gambiensis TaxID=67801 RepID=A0A1B0AKQ1_9MUSC
MKKSPIRIGTISETDHGCPTRDQPRRKQRGGKRCDAFNPLQTKIKARKFKGADNAANVDARTENSGIVELAEDRELKFTMKIEALQEVVGGLSPHDKVVQLYFDEAYTNGKMRNFRTEDILYGCGYNKTQTITTTEEYHTVPFFAVRSLLTSFNMLISVTAITAYNGAPDELDRCLGIAEEAGLEVNANLHTLRADGTVCTIYHLVDYIHVMYSIYYLMVRSNLFDTSAVTKAHAGKLSISNYLKRRGACLINTAASSLKDCMQLFTPATVANLDVAVQRKIIHKEEDIRTYEVIAALTALCEVMHMGEISSAEWEGQKAILLEAKTSNKDLEPEFPRRNVLNIFLEALSIYLAIMKFHMVDPNIDKRTQATIMKQLAFFKKTGSCHHRALGPPAKSSPTRCVHRLISMRIRCMLKIKEHASFCTSTHRFSRMGYFRRPMLNSRKHPIYRCYKLMVHKYVLKSSTNLKMFEKQNKPIKNK